MHWWWDLYRFWSQLSRFRIGCKHKALSMYAGAYRPGADVEMGPGAEQTGKLCQRAREWIPGFVYVYLYDYQVAGTVKPSLRCTHTHTQARARARDVRCCLLTPFAEVHWNFYIICLREQTIPSESLDFWTLSIIRNSEWKTHALETGPLCILRWGSGGGHSFCEDPLERANLNHWTEASLENSARFDAVSFLWVPGGSVTYKDVVLFGNWICAPGL
jgi:hypothetical protein